MNKIVHMLIITAMISTSTVAFAQSETKPNKLTHGTVKKFITKGETTQAEILEMFGGPSITTISKGGDEVWTYDRVSYTTTTHGGPDTNMILLGGATGAGVGAIIGHQSRRRSGEGALIGGITGAIAGWLAGYKTPVHEQGTRTVTLMLWFDENDLVKDYSIISTQY